MKIAAIQSLSEHPETYQFIVNILKYEKDQHVIDTIIACLERSPEIALPILIESTIFINKQMLSCAGKLVSTGMPKKKVSESLDINNTALSLWIESKSGKRIINRFNAQVLYNNLGKNIELDDIMKIEKEYILKKAIL